MHRRLLSAAILAALHLSSYPVLAAPASAPLVGTTTELPRSVRPLHYDVAIVPDAAAGAFKGKVSVQIKVRSATDRIVLNAQDLRFERVTLTSAQGGAAQTPAVSVDAARQTATFRFARPLKPGSYVLAMDYSGIIGSQAVGLFSIDYDTDQGKRRALYTQFENSDARRMIPSWDEPNYKASFALQVTVPAAQMAVSNMPASSTEALADGKKRVVFAPTPKMSTYLLFFALGDFERATASEGGTELGVVTTRGGTAKARFALDSSVAVLREYNEYFGVKYPLPKLDNVAAPGRSQFFGAMENWGAIFTFEYAMLLDPAISTQHDREEVFAIAAHEMAHQWFGDLVTMRWWDDLWLNEGFASWMENRTMARLHPEWNTALSAVAVRETAMARDSVATTHPVVQHVETPEQASQAFDDITYQKGESVIRMLEHYVGADAWRDGVRSYMAKHAYGNTVSDDLWKEIEKAAGRPMTAIAHDFTLQPGVPLIRVGAASCKGGVTELALEQGEFSRDQPHKKPLRWRVPVVAQAMGSAETARTVVTGGKGLLRVPGCGAVVVNAGQSGYYRVLYGREQFKALAKEFGSLPALDQLGLLADSAALGRGGQQSAADVLELAQGVSLQGDPQVWGRIAGVYQSIHAAYAGERTRQQRFDAYAVKRLAPVLAQTGWVARDGENATVASLRDELIGVLGELGDPATIAEARTRYAASAKDPAALPGALRKTVMRVVATHADEAAWNALHAQALQEKSPMIKDQYYNLLASSEDEALAKRAMELAMTDEPGVTNSAPMLAQVANKHPELAFDFAVAHMAKVNERVDGSSRSRYFPRLAAKSADPKMIAKVEGYAKAHLAPGARRDAQTATAEIRDRIRVRSTRLPEIDAWLAAHQ